MTSRWSRAALCAVVTAAVLLGANASASAQRADDEPESVVVERYGWQIAAVDVAAIAAGLATDEPVVFAVGFALSGPAVHLAHLHGGRAFGSLAARFTLTGVGAIAGFIIGCAGDDSDFFCDAGDYPIGGALVGAAAAAIADWTFLGTVRERREPAGLALAPIVRPGHGGLTLGLAGRF